MLLALEADAWQWCDIAEEDFSLLDALGALKQDDMLVFAVEMLLLVFAVEMLLLVLFHISTLLLVLVYRHTLTVT